MMGKPDLHSHSTASDGLLAPEALVGEAVRNGVTTLALTDHDTMDGVDQLKGRTLQLQLIPGVELSLRDMRGLHLLGYGVTPAHELRGVLRNLAAQRLDRAHRMLEKLAELGMPLDAERVKALSRGSVGRPHIARAMVEAGYVVTVEEAFARWIGNDGPAYVAGERLSMAEALPLMRRNGFVPVLAHPAELNKDDLTLRALLETWRAQGLLGVEVYHPSQKGRGFAMLDTMVRRMGLLVTGGSDYHGSGDRHGMLGCMAGEWRHSEEDMFALENALNGKT